MNILLPWNLSYFIPLNGFHPLYRGILEYERKYRLIIPKYDLSYSQYQYLEMQGVYSKKIDDELWWLKDLDDKLKDKFYDFFAKREINFASYLPGDIEFLHTAPITKGDRAFIVHVESFLPFFMPFSFQGEKDILPTLLKVREGYKKLLLKNCVSIVSHNKYTLKELSDFFQDEKIDALLKYVPIGVPYEPIEIVTNSEKIIFLFVASAHQNINNFVYKGGMVAISSALKLLEEDANKYQFIFRTKRPPAETFIPYGIDLKLLDKFEDDGIIIWLESNISEKSLKRLFSKSDFIFLASASLHSDAVLRAMMYGTIPIVTDIEPYDIYLDDEVSIRIKGVKDYIIKTEVLNNTTVYHDDYSLFPKLHSMMVDQIILKIANMNEETKIVMSSKLIKKFKNNFQTENMIQSLFDLFKEAHINNNVDKRPILCLGEDYIEDLTQESFKTISQPYTLYRVGFGIMRKLFNHYLFFPSSQENSANDLYSFSHLNILKHKYSKSLNNHIKSFINLNDSIKYLHQIINPDYTGFKRYFLIKYKISIYLKRFPWIYLSIKWCMKIFRQTIMFLKLNKKY